MRNIQYLLALHSIDGFGPIRLKAVIDYFKDPKLAWEANTAEIRQIGIPQNVVNLLAENRKTLDPQKYMEKITKKGIKWLTIFDENYPALLKQIHDPPVIFYYIGEILSQDANSIAIVGTRKITGYGRHVTEKFSKVLSIAGLTIVSGLARGVDSVAHRSAILEKGRTIAVLGGGLNKIFPYENQALAKDIANGFGAVISEYPPDYPSRPGNFPSRNRIIAGLSIATLVTEAAVDSGSLITAKFAIELGREVFAVPGPVTSELSKGPIDLIRMGARAVFEAQEILDEMGVKKVSSIKYQVSREKLTDEERQVMECLGQETMHVDEICRKLNISASHISGTLLKMEISGIVQNLGGNMYSKS